ncbi:hypothetical protein FB446DRAFT_710720 [Lentinula raphanica]|nr:hypothetical protein FB446DRAFT_710720 [Lentinula raphanica]
MRVNMFCPGLITQTLFVLLLGSGLSSLTVSAAPVDSSTTLVNTGASRSVAVTSMHSRATGEAVHLNSRVNHPLHLTPQEIPSLPEKFHFRVWFASASKERQNVRENERQGGIITVPGDISDAVKKRIAEEEHLPENWIELHFWNTPRPSLEEEKAPAMSEPAGFGYEAYGSGLPKWVYYEKQQNFY